MSQAKLLRVLEERQVERLGGRTGIDVDFRLVSATNRPLELLVSERRFREDLYYRINAFTIRLPSLKERPEDIPLLARMFLAKQCAIDGLPRRRAAVQQRRAQPPRRPYVAGEHPGADRDGVARASLSSDGPVIDERHVGFLALNTVVPGPSRANDPRHPPARRRRARPHPAALSATGWNKKETARLLQISRETLYRKIRTFQLMRQERVSPVTGSDASTSGRWA